MSMPNSLSLKLYLKTLVSDVEGVNPLLMSLLTVNFKIVPETLVNLGSNLSIVPLKLYLKTLVSDTGGQSSFFQCPW